MHYVEIIHEGKVQKEVMCDLKLDTSRLDNGIKDCHFFFKIEHCKNMYLALHRATKSQKI